MNGSYRKPRVDVYTALLAIALAAVVLAAIFAYLETADYGDQKYRGAPTIMQADGVPPAPTRLARDLRSDGNACASPMVASNVGWPKAC